MVQQMNEINNNKENIEEKQDRTVILKKEIKKIDVQIEYNSNLLKKMKESQEDEKYFYKKNINYLNSLDQKTAVQKGYSDYELNNLKSSRRIDNIEESIKNIKKQIAKLEEEKYTKQKALNKMLLEKNERGENNNGL